MSDDPNVREYVTENLVAWLRAKYARHGELEDKYAADALESYALKLGAVEKELAEWKELDELRCLEIAGLREKHGTSLIRLDTILSLPDRRDLSELGVFSELVRLRDEYRAAEEQCPHEYAEIPDTPDIQSNGYSVCVKCGDLKAPDVQEHGTREHSPRQVSGSRSLETPDAAPTIQEHNPDTCFRSDCPECFAADMGAPAVEKQCPHALHGTAFPCPACGYQPPEQPLECTCLAFQSYGECPHILDARDSEEPFPGDVYTPSTTDDKSG